MIGLSLLACEAERVPLAEEHRPLGEARIGGRTVRFEGLLHGWHHGAGFEGGCASIARDDVYVGVRVDVEPGLVRGDLDATWHLNDLSLGREHFAALTLESCAADDRIAYRVPAPSGVGTPWRVFVPDEVGGAAGLVEADGLSCDDALAWAGPAATWRRDRAAHPAACAHLYRLGPREDGLRCVLREPPHALTKAVVRQDLPGALTDAGWDARVIEVLDPSTPGDTSRFAPYRVRSVLDRVADRQAVFSLAERIDAQEGALLPWQASVVGAAVAELGDRAWAERLWVRIDHDLATPGTDRAASAQALLQGVSELVDPSSLQTRMALARTREDVPTRSWRPPLGPEYEAAPCRAEDRLDVAACPSLATFANAWLRAHR